MSTEAGERVARPFSDRSIRLAGRMLKIVMKEPNERERIDALAALCNAALSFRKERPETYRRLTSHDAFGSPVR